MLGFFLNAVLILFCNSVNVGYDLSWIIKSEDAKNSILLVKASLFLTKPFFKSLKLSSDLEDINLIIIFFAGISKDSIKTPFLSKID